MDDHDMAWMTLAPAAGGDHRCGRWWCAPETPPDGQLRLYATLGGSGWISYGARRSALRPGRLLLIPGNAPLARHTAAEVRIAWLHLLPRAPALVHDVEALAAVVAVASDAYAPGVAALERIAAQCDPQRHRLPERWGAGVPQEIEGLVLALIGRGLAESPSVPAAGGLVVRAREWCLAHWREQPSLTEIATAVGCSGDHLRRRFVAATGRSPIAWCRELALREARYLLADPELTVSEVARACGFSDPLYFSRVCRRHFGRAPTALRTAPGP